MHVDSKLCCFQFFCDLYKLYCNNIWTITEQNSEIKTKLRHTEHLVASWKKKEVFGAYVCDVYRFSRRNFSRRTHCL